MGKYFNRTRSPLSASLRDGGTAYFAPKKWISLTPEQEGSSAVIQLVKKGFLVRREESKASAVVAPAAPPLAPLPVSSPSPDLPKPPPVVLEVSETNVHADVTIETAESTQEPPFDADPTSTNSDVGEKSVASEGAVETESKSTRRSKSRRR